MQRFCFVVCTLVLLVRSLPSAQGPSSLPLAGFRQVIIHPPQYRDGSVDPMGLAPYLEQLLTKQGWSIVRPAQDWFRPEARQAASETMQCSLGHDDGGWGTMAFLRCADVLGHELFSLSEKGVAMTVGGEVKAAVRNVAKRLAMMRPRFDARQTVDILSRLPNAETHQLTESQLDQMAQTGALSFDVEGVWAATDESAYRLGIVAVDAGREFVVVVLDSPRTYLWQAGMVKAHLTPAADGQTFAAKWRMGNRSEAAGLAALNGGSLRLSLRRDGKDETITLIKLRPAAPGRAAASSNPATVASGTGTGFLCANGIVATSNHVIDGAKRIELYLPVQKRSVRLQLVVADATNDLALLRVAEEDQAYVPDALALTDSGDVKLGADAFVIGFPLGDALGADHKVTAGIVSALDGLNGDPRMIQLTAPIQPGSSGSPVFDSAGRVVGIVRSTLDTFAAVRASGQVPQNINFAVKSDYLALLLKRVPPVSKPEDRARTAPLQLTELVQRVRGAVGQIQIFK